jgi:hypothetical protein
LLHLIKLLRLLPNHRSYPRPKFTRLPLLPLQPLISKLVQSPKPSLKPP